MSARLAQHTVSSPSAALTDLYEPKRPWLDEVTGAVEVQEDQVGMVGEIAGRPLALDLTSRAEVFADLAPRLLEGYGVAAMNWLTLMRPEPSESAAHAFFDKTMSSRSRWLPTPGMGDAFALTRRSIHGCGLRAEGELVCLSAFPAGQ